MRRLRSGVIGSIRAWLPSRRSTAHQRGAFVVTVSRPGAVGQDDGGEGGVAVDRHPRGLLRIAYVRVLRCVVHGRVLLWRGLDSAPVGRSAGAGNARGHGRTRGEGADLGEGLAAAGKQEAAAHGATVAADQATSQRHGQPSAWTGGPDGRRARRTRAGRCSRRLPACRELARQEAPLPLLRRCRPPRPTPRLGALAPVSRPARGSWWSSGVPRRLAVPVAQLPVAVERVPGAACGSTGADRATSRRRCTGCPGERETAPGRVPHGVLRHACESPGRRGRRGEPECCHLGDTSDNAQGEIPDAGLRTAHGRLG